MRQHIVCSIAALLWAAGGCSGPVPDGNRTTVSTPPSAPKFTPNGPDTLQAWSVLRTDLGKQYEKRATYFFKTPLPLFDFRPDEDSFGCSQNGSVDPEVVRLAIVLREWDREESRLALKVLGLYLHYDLTRHRMTPDLFRMRLGGMFFSEPIGLKQLVVPKRDLMEVDRERWSASGIRRAEVEAEAESLASFLVEHRRKLSGMAIDAEQIRAALETKYRVSFPKLRVADAVGQSEDK